jgi:Zn finger protein HypA/HybF involved in hydrogenase expression
MTQQTVETCCQACKNPVTEKEVACNKCESCGSQLSAPIQNASIVVDPVYFFGKTM